MINVHVHVHVHIGDWVRFQLSGYLVIGVVEYIVENKYDSSDPDVVTSMGRVHLSEILEVRCKAVEVAS